MSQKELILIGGGHAHLVTLSNLHVFIKKGFMVTVVQPSRYHYYSGMGAGMLGKTYRPEDIRFDTKGVVERQGGIFLEGKVTHIEPEERIVFLESGNTLSYDVLSFNAGSYVPRGDVSESNKDLFLVKPIQDLVDAQNRIIELAATKDIKIGIIGGGASSVEIAGNVWQLGRDFAEHSLEIKIFSGREILGRAPSKVSRMARGILSKRGIDLLENSRVREIRDGRIILESGQPYDMDLIFIAVGVMPSAVIEASGLSTGPKGGLRVNRYLQNPEYSNIFGGGDCIYFEERPLDKVGVYAVRQNPILYHNLLASLEKRDLKPFDPGGDYLLIYNLGGCRGIFHKWSVVFGGRPAFMLKDYIDRKFMKKFQAIESV